MNKTMLFIVNPAAGKGQIKSKLLSILDIFTKQGYDITIRITQSREDATLTAMNHGGKYDLIVCSGGDGTLSEVINGVMKAGGNKPPIAYIPAGTTNDFANTLGIPYADPIAAARLAVRGTPAEYDIGCFNGKYFTYSAAFGAFTDVSYITPQKTKSMLGRAAYILQGIERLSSLRSYALKIKCGERELEGDFIFGLVSNSDSVGGFKGIFGTDTELSDGLFEIVLVRMPRTIIELNTIVMSILSKEMDAPGLYSFKCSHVEINSDEPLAWTLDGEFGGAPTKSNIEIINNAVKYVANRKSLQSK